MPYINSTITIKVSDEKKEILKAKLGEIISVIPGKSEQWLMVGFNDNYTLYFKGQKKVAAAFVEVKIFGGADRLSKEAVVAKISELFEEELAISKDNLYITFEEVSDWGWNGKMF